MFEGVLGTFALVIGAWFLVALRREQWLSMRTAESWYAVGLIALGLLLLGLSVSHLALHRESSAPSRSALAPAFREGS